ncbi:MAG: hypothetical protein K2X03_20610 [Bryobacteraceae bacterium]|nr:hypothetical protein [Bryobacteraceae bacterium]
MPNPLIDQLLRATLPSQVTKDDGLLGPAAEALRTLTSQIESLRGLYQSQTVQTAENTTAVLQNTRSRAADAGSTASTIVKTAGSALGGGLTLFPLVSGLAKLFGFGGKKEEVPALSPFALPSAVDLDGGVSQSGSSAVGSVSYGQNGLPRRTPTAASGPNISVNVQAMDARSFLDHSDDIARAVREAMLNSHPLNDVISEV